MQSFTIVLLVAAVACANAGLLAQPAAVAYTGLTSAYASPAVYNSYAPVVNAYSAYARPAAYSYAAAPVYRSAYAAAPLTTYGSYAAPLSTYGAYGYRTAYSGLNAVQYV